MKSNRVDMWEFKFAKGICIKLKWKNSCEHFTVAFLIRTWLHKKYEQYILYKKSLYYSERHEFSMQLHGM